MVNSTSYTIKKERGQTEPGLVALYDISGQETERVYSYNSGAKHVTT